MIFRAFAHGEGHVLISDFEFGDLLGCTEDEMGEFLSAHRNRVTDEEFEKIKELAAAADRQSFLSDDQLSELILMVRQ